MSNINFMVNKINQMKKLYESKKVEILKRLELFRKVWNKNDREIFSELCFCILTPQSKAEVCDEIINILKRNQILFKGNTNKMRPFIKKARFYKNKSRYIIEGRKFFRDNERIAIKNKLDINNIFATRDWLVKNIKGIGYKEASHFLRNIGFGENLAILDVHILRNLKKFGIIKKLPKSLTKNRYLDIENRLKRFSERIEIPMAHLDLLFWSVGTGRIFK